MKNYLPLLLLLVSCGSSTTQEEDIEVVNETEFVAPEVPDHNFYVDENLVKDVTLEFGESQGDNAKPVLVQLGSKSYEVLKYEGTLMKASGMSDGYSLRFEPYHYFDENLDEEVKSKYDFYLDIHLSKAQNNYLGYVISSPETKNLEWDYFENLFEVFYYEKEGTNYPLKLNDLGKTEWDG